MVIQTQSRVVMIYLKKKKESIALGLIYKTVTIHLALGLIYKRVTIHLLILQNISF